MSPENKHEFLFTIKQDWSDVRSIFGNQISTMLPETFLRTRWMGIDAYLSKPSNSNDGLIIHRQAANTLRDLISTLV